jgi:hypothetical protein
MNIHIFYSHYNVTGTDNKSRPNWFDYEKCFLNLLNTIKDKNNVKLNIVMDGKIEDNWIKKYKELYNAYEFKGGSMEIVTKAVYKIIKEYKCDSNDLIYILENDYLHVEGWSEKLVELYKTFNRLNYISLYDHNDKYILPQYEDLTSKIVTTNSHHWRTTPSTCGSYIVPKHIFDDDYEIQTTVIGDHVKHVYLNEHKGRFILTPIPGLSTHCMKYLLSPTINWEKTNNQI